MRIGLALIGLLAVCYAQYEQSESASDSSDFFSCQGREDGNYGTDCSEQYFTCVSGETTLRLCPDGLHFNQDADICDYPPQHCFGEDSLNSDTVVQDVNQEDQAEDSENLGYGEQSIEDSIDCSERPDGFYSEGCTEIYTVCSFGSSTQTRCYPGLVFDQMKSRCTYPQDCGLPEPTVAQVIEHQQPAVPAYQSPETTTQYVPAPETTTQYVPAPVATTQQYATATTTQRYVPETTAFSPVESTTAQSPGLDCSGKADGTYSIGCVASYYQCSAGIAYKFQCPSGLVFDATKERCDYNCVAADTSIYETSTTEVYSTQEPVAQDEPVVVTDAPTTAVPTDVPTGCVDGDTSLFGQCSTKFRRCRNGRWAVSRCPGMTVFDETIGLCVYELPRCKTPLFSKTTKTYPTSSYGIASTAGNTYQAPTAYTPVAAPVYSAPVAAPVYSAPVAAPAFVPYPFKPSYVSNPFYAYRRDGKDRYHDRKHRDRKHGKGRHDKFQGQKINKGKIAYKTRSPFVRGDRQYVVDQFSGRRGYTPRIINKVFPTYNKKWRTTTEAPEVAVPEVVVPEFEEPPIANMARSAASSEAPQTINTFQTESVAANATDAEEMGEGSGEESETPRRMKRSYGVVESGADSTLTSGLCANEAVGSLVSLGNCRQDFVYCESSNNEVIAACPVGELFDEAAKKCSVADYCGENSEIIVPSLPVDEIDNIVAESTVESQAAHVEPAPLTQSSESSVLSETYVQRPVVSGNSEPIVSSQGYTHHPVSEAVSVQSNRQEQSAPVAPSRDAEPITEEIQFDACEGRINGFFAVGCSTKYFICDNGRTIEMSCANGLVFNERRIACDYRDNVQSCDESTPVPAAVEPIDVQPVVPYKPVSAPVETLNGKCLRDGFFAENHCSGHYYSCKNGVQAHSFACANGDVFSERLASCVSRSKAGCSVESVPYTPAVTVPSVAQVTEPAQDLAATEKYETITKSPVRGYDAYSAETSTDASVVVETTTVQAADSSCPVGPYADSECSTTYKLCAGGIIHELNCPSGLIFSIDRCEYPQFAPGCENVVLETTSAAAQVALDDVVDVTSGYQASQESTTVTYANTVASDNQVAQPECQYGEYRSYAIGSCSNSYKICTEEGKLINSNCDYGLVYDEQSGTCVSSVSCTPKVNEDVPTTVTSETVTPSESSTLVSSPELTTVSTATPCSGKKDYETIAYGECRDSFMRCINGAPVTEHCAKSHVYSASHGRCVRREKLSECSESQIEYVVPSGNFSDFCNRRRDGLYRNPKVCSGILQCFGGELYARPSCPGGLVFNEKNDQCDYRHNVPGCEDVSADPNLENGCRGQKHGAYLADNADCTIFYRCVWDRLEKMACPSGTVFNPVFSVCDWPANVPNCANGSVISSTPSADIVSETTVGDSNLPSEKPMSPY